MNRSALTWLVLLVLQGAASTVAAGPGAPDLTIRTRRTIDRPGAAVFTHVIYLKGQRQRRETLVERPPQAGTSSPARDAHTTVDLTQCDERRTVLLNGEARTYAYVPIEDIAGSVALARARAAADATGQEARREATTTGPTVTITIDAVDTGERRQIGRYTARHVITTRKTEPGPGARARASLYEQDGWYIDLPDANCADAGAGGHTTTMLVAIGPPDRIEIKQLGTARGGYPIEEIERSRHDAIVIVTKTEMLAFSEAPLDAALFTVPPGYRAALPDLRGGYDLTRPDTVLNRLASYREAIVSWARQLLR